MGLLHKLENTGKRLLSGNPRMKRWIKRCYQRTLYLCSPKIQSEGRLERISPREDAHWFFGYYDKSPWDAGGRYMLCLRAEAVDAPAPDAPAQLMLIDTRNGNAARCIAHTRAWNTQQGCMAQWLGPDFSRRVLYNDFRNGSCCSVIFNVETGREEGVLPRAMYTVARSGNFGMSVDFFRLHRLRPGYGYSNLPDSSAEQACPDASCIERVEISSGRIVPILRYSDLAAFRPRKEMQGAVHKVNHLMLNPSGTRMMLLHRWFVGQKKYSRLITCSPDGTDLRLLADEEFVSHCCWKSDDEILGYLRSGGKDGYYLLQDREDAQPVYKWPQLDSDGHMGYSPDGRSVVTDTYPDQRRLSSVYIAENDGSVQRIARVFSPFRYDGDLRCDLHPRWSPAGDRIAIDSTHEGSRGLYVIQTEKA